MLTQFLSLVLVVAAPPEPRLKTAQSDAERCIEATVKGNVERVVDLTHPNVVAALGGREKCIDRLREQRNSLENDGTSYISGEAGVPDKLYDTKSGQYCVVPVSYRVKVDGSKFIIKSPLIGVSTDQGKTWKFLETSPGEATIRKIVPDIPKELKYPADEEPQPEPEAK